MIVRGPFTIKWGDNEATDVEALDIEHEIDSEDFTTLQGRTVEIDGSFKASATMTSIDASIPFVAAFLPQHFVANGAVLSTGETVDHAEGAIDVVPKACDEEMIYNNLEIESCANPGQVVRLVNCRTKLESIELTDKIKKVAIKFVGEASTDQATMQFFRAGTISTVS